MLAQTALNTEAHPDGGAFFCCKNYVFDFKKPLVMGIVNVSDDSFSNDGLKGDSQAAIDKVYRLIDAGADIIDLGAESTRPGAQYCTAEHEIDRLLPVIDAIKHIGKPISVDTNKTAVMKAVIDAGADIINDIRALQDEGAVELLAQSDVGVCLMHMQNDPQNMQDNPVYDNITENVLSFLKARAKICEEAGIAKSRIMLDPGFGFGKTCAHNVTLFKNLAQFCNTGYPVLVGVSRKRFLGEITGRDLSDRACVSAAAAMLAVKEGAHIVRVHDVKETKDMISLYQVLA